MFSAKDSLITVSFQTMSHKSGRSHRGHCRAEDTQLEEAGRAGEAMTGFSSEEYIGFS